MNLLWFYVAIVLAISDVLHTTLMWKVLNNFYIVLGGLIQEETKKTVNKIPILGDIPGIGAAFRSSSSVKIKTELVILITPKIIRDNEDVGINNL